jgi:thioredoxin reductase (NADPH)
MSDVDIAIIGAGPTGLFAAYYAGFRGLSTVVIDTLPEAGGQVTAMYPEKQIFDVGGFPQVLGRDLIANLVVQAGQFNPQYKLGTQAKTLSYVDGLPVLGLADGAELSCGSIIITGGLGSFTPRPLPAAGGFSGEGILFFVPQPAVLAGQHVVIVGGGDSAFDWALALAEIAASVTLVHRRDKFRAHQATVDRVKELPVRILVNSQVTKISGTSSVESVEVNGSEVLPADTIVAALGFTADLGPLTEWGVIIEKRQILVDSTMATNQPRIFAAGDIVEYPGKVRLIATGFGEAATAVNNAAIVINPDAHLFPGHSSNA